MPLFNKLGMRVVLIAIGKTKFAYIQHAIADYNKKINQFLKFEYKEISNSNLKKISNLNIMREKEAEIILKYLNKEDKLILLDERGKEFNSVEFSNYIETAFQSLARRLVFVIGGAYGFSDSIRKKADIILSLSKMTFSHQLTRIVFLEQLYRALTIINRHPYHNE
ncbi:23S rRNA (pseudouridine(1915)-N(3))-methyltransferase RlmH [Bacteroidota bacterium]